MLKHGFVLLSCVRQGMELTNLLTLNEHGLGMFLNYHPQSKRESVRHKANQGALPEIARSINVVQWNPDLSKFLVTTKNLLKSRSCLFRGFEFTT